LEHESHHHHHPHGTGVRWLDVTLAVAAAIVSLVSLWLGLHSAHSMEKLVAANSYPYLELMRSTSTMPSDEKKSLRRMVSYEMQNNGVGPARIEWVQFFFKGQPVADLSALGQACCAGAGGNFNGMNLRGGVDNSLVRPGGSLVMFSWPEPEESNPRFDALHRQMKDITYSACYCSVFDECYIRKASGGKPQPVEQCTAPGVTFQPRTVQQG